MVGIHVKPIVHYKMISVALYPESYIIALVPKSRNLGILVFTFVNVN